MAIIQSTSYAYVVDLSLPLSEARARIVAAFEKQGFGPISEIDIQAKMKEKLAEDIDGYLILGMCNPRLALRAIQADPNIGVFLPCNVVVRSTSMGTQVAAQRPERLIEVAEGTTATSVAQIADALILAAMKSI